MDYIEWNYIQAKKQADRLEEQAGRLSKLASEQMENTLRELAYNWKGSSASAYIRKGEKVESGIGALARELKRTAEVIRSSAERTYQAEMRATELAKSRSYS